MNILLCQHGGSGNHGCEALARTAEMLLRKAFPQGNITLYSYRLGDDELYLRDSAMTLAGLRDLPGKYSPHNLCYHLKKRLLGPDKASKLPITGQFRQLLKKYPAAAREIVPVFIQHPDGFLQIPQLHPNLHPTTALEMA